MATAVGRSRTACVGLLLPQLCRWRPSLAPVPVPCLLARGIPVPPAACAHSGSNISDFGGCFPLYHSPAHANLLSGLGYLEMTLKGNPWTGIPTKPKVGSTPVSSHPCPHAHHAPVMTVLRGVSMLGCLVLHGVPMPRACLPAACPGRNVGAGLGVPVGMWEQGWVPRACRSRTRWRRTCRSSFPSHESVWLEA